MPRKKTKTSHQQDTPGQFFRIPYQVIRSKQYQSCSGNAIKFITQLGLQFNGKNNGDICATAKVLKIYGLVNNRKNENCLKQAVESGLLMKTRQGGRNRCCLYGFTWLRINECLDSKGNHKLDIAPTNKPPVLF